jgi:hypothetical protein
MAIIPGSGASIVPIFNDNLSVDSVIVKNGGSGYDENNPPFMRIINCGIPSRPAILEPVIHNGKIVSVKVLDGGAGYNPLRVALNPQVPTGEEQPDPATAEVILKEDGSIDYIKMVKYGDKQYYDVEAEILGAVGGGAVIKAVAQTVTGLAVLNDGSNYETPPALSISGGGGRGAKGVANIDTRGIVSSNVLISNPGQFYLQAPYILLTGGGGLGAKAKAIINQGSISSIQITNPGADYTSPPNVVFARNVKVKRVNRNRQIYNLEKYNLSGLVADIGRDDTDIYLSTTAPYPGSGTILLNKEIIRYTGKTAKKLSGCTRGVNFRYDQRIILDNLQNNPVTGITAYNFNIGDRVIRTIEVASSKIAKVYDWNPVTRELFVIFEVDELAFIDAGSPGERTNVVFDAGVADSSDSFDNPHTIIDEENAIIYKLTQPPSFILDKAFEDIIEFDGDGNGLPDLNNTGTAFENQINLDGGNASTLYGIEETQGGQNTTLFQVGDRIKDSSLPFKIANISDASALSEGVEHYAIIRIEMDTSNPNFFNGINFVVGETVTGANSQVEATVKSWDSVNKILILENPVPYDTGTLEDGVIYEFSSTSTVIDLRIITIGNNYASAPSVTIADTGIFQATATCSLTGDQVTSISVTGGGYGYTSKPTVTFGSGGGGSGAIAEAVLGGERIIGDNGAIWTIKSVNYDTLIRNDEF